MAQSYFPGAYEFNCKNNFIARNRYLKEMKYNKGEINEV